MLQAQRRPEEKNVMDVVTVSYQGGFAILRYQHYFYLGRYVFTQTLIFKVFRSLPESPPHQTCFINLEKRKQPGLARTLPWLCPMFFPTFSRIPLLGTISCYACNFGLEREHEGTHHEDNTWNPQILSEQETYLLQVKGRMYDSSFVPRPSIRLEHCKAKKNNVTADSMFEGLGQMRFAWGLL